MRHRRQGRKLGKTATHRRAMFSNMAISLFDKGRIETTVPKAKELRSLAERLITAAKRGNAGAAGGAREKQLAARRHVARIVRDPEVLKKLFDEIAPRYTERPGGYTRIVRLGATRVGDGAQKAILELLAKDEEGRKKKKTSRKTYRKLDMPAAPGVAKKHEKPAAEAAPAAEAPAAEAAAAEAPKAEAAPAAAPKAEHKGEAHKAEKKEKAKGAEPKPKGKK